MNCVMMQMSDYLEEGSKEMLVTCPECDAKISHEAEPCPKCGLPRAGKYSKEWCERLVQE